MTLETGGGENPGAAQDGKDVKEADASRPEDRSWGQEARALSHRWWIACVLQFLATHAIGRA